MFECLIIGDSIAVGTAAAVNPRIRTACEVQARESITVEKVIAWPRPGKIYHAIIVAIGSNNTAGPALDRALERLRSQLRGGRVIWVLPYGRSQAYAVRSVAVRHGDEALDLARFRTSDHVHPSDYRDVAGALLTRQ